MCVCESLSQTIKRKDSDFETLVLEKPLSSNLPLFSSIDFLLSPPFFFLNLSHSSLLKSLSFFLLFSCCRRRWIWISPMVAGGAPMLSARVRKTIQSIKEIVGNHSDADIYSMLKETNMDPNETAQKLLNQDPFHEVRRKKDKKKENTGYMGSLETRKRIEQTRQVPKPQTPWNRNAWRGEGVSQKFRVVRDNRVNQNSAGDVKPTLLQCSTSTNEQVNSTDPLKSSPGILTDQKQSDARRSEHLLPSQSQNGAHDSGPGHARNANPNGPRRQALPESSRSIAHNSTLQVQAQKPLTSPQTATSSNSSIVGLYSSSTDPVHVPSPDSRSSGAVGAIKREVGVVGVRRQSSQDVLTRSSVQNNSFSALLGKEISASTESFRQGPLRKGDQFNQTSASQPVVSSITVGRSLLGNQYNSRLQQQPVGHQRVSLHNMEWKPKSSQKSSHTNPGISGASAAPISSPAINSTVSTEDATQLREKLSQVNVLEDQHVIIPQHLRVPEADRSQLTFGSFGTGFDSTKNFMSGLKAVGSAEEPRDEPAVSISLSVPVSSNEDVSGGDEVELLHDEARSGTDSPASDAASGHPLDDEREPASPRKLDGYRNVDLVQSSPSYRLEESQQQQDPPSLATFPAYDHQTGYDEPFFRSAMDENLRGQVLPPQEALSVHTANSSPASTVPVVQQQHVPQLYPQVHIPHFANFMPYRHLLPQVYVPPMPMPNYSSNPAYPHPPNGSSYLMMQGGSSHLATGSMKYAASQYKPVPIGGPTGYGNYSNPAAYTMNTPGSVGNATGLEDAARIKYKEGNLYIPNPQAETSEMWVQTPRELSSMQSTPYYNLSGQSPHTAYVPSHAGHTSFNAPTQSTHVSFPGLYHPPQPTAIANPHHLVHQQLPGMGGNVGVGVAAPGPQVGAYQQPQLGHLNWTANF